MDRRLEKKGLEARQRGTVANEDLWRELDELRSRHEVKWTWVKGHAGHVENERCDELATTAADGKGLIEDSGFEG